MRILAGMWMGAVIIGVATGVWAQEGGFGEGGGGMRGAGGGVADIRIVKPVVEKGAGGVGGGGGGGVVTLPGAFWNEKLAEWLDVAVCGRPSDFLHETVLSLTATRTDLEKALREAGFRDGDAWAGSVQDFAQLRGDRLMITAEIEREGRKETYSLDEMISFLGWDVPVGPYGFMYKGEPGTGAATARAGAGGGGPVPHEEVGGDAAKILKDDPQIALTFRGIQSMSQSFADHPLAYHEWVYPMMRMGRNYSVLPAKVYDSNGQVAVTVHFKKVTEEELLRESARLWHDRDEAKLILEQVPVAQELDKDREAYWRLHQKKDANPAEVRAVVASMAKGYATLDAAWGSWAARHAQFATKDPHALESLKQEAERWRRHVETRKTAAEEIAVAERAALQQQGVRGETAEGRAQLQKLRGEEIAARSQAMLAENKETGERWREEQKGLDPKTDPRVDWVKEVSTRVALADAKEKMGTLGIELGKALQGGGEGAGGAGGGGGLGGVQARYAEAARQVQVLGIQLQVGQLDYEIRKREGFENDPDLPGLRKQRELLQSQLRQLTTQPAAR